MMKFLVPFFGLLAMAWGQTTSVNACLRQGNESDLPINIYVLGCPTPPCAFAHNTDAVLEIIFKSRRRTTSMVTEAWAYILGPIGVPYDLGEESKTCNFFTNTYCPLQANEVVMYMLRMPIEPWMPAGTSVTVEFLIRDTADNSIVTCARVPIRITAALENTATPQLTEYSSGSQNKPVATQ